MNANKLTIIVGVPGRISRENALLNSFNATSNKIRHAALIAPGPNQKVEGTTNNGTIATPQLSWRPPNPEESKIENKLLIRLS